MYFEISCLEKRYQTKTTFGAQKKTLSFLFSSLSHMMFCLLQILLCDLRGRNRSILKWFFGKIIEIVLVWMKNISSVHSFRLISCDVKHSQIGVISFDAKHIHSINKTKKAFSLKARAWNLKNEKNCSNILWRFYCGRQASEASEETTLYFRSNSHLLLFHTT